MHKVQIVYASRHGATAGIAARIAEVLRRRGHDVVIADAAAAPGIEGYDAHVIGSGVYTGSWLKEAIQFLEANEGALSMRTVWLFSSGPLPGSTKNEAGLDGLEAALGPAAGPGSGGRKRVEALTEMIQPRDHRVFLGAYNPDDPPQTLPERVIRLLPGARGILPAGDFREWQVIEAWAEGIAAELEALVPVG